MLMTAAHLLFSDNEQLAKSGMNCLENLVMGAGHSFREADWDLIIDTITDVYAQTLPADMRIWKPTLDSSFDQVCLQLHGSSWAVRE